MGSRLRAGALLCGLILTAHAADIRTYNLTGLVPYNGADFFYVPFDVPEGVAELEVMHTFQSTANILDFGVSGSSNQMPCPAIGLQPTLRHETKRAMG
jgi:hypothetical protein